MNTYLALTIGPIYKTLGLAKRTREFWGCSYMFSWIMREIISGMIGKGTIAEENILMPHRNKHDNPKIGTGLYHDRLLVQISPEKKEQALNEFKNVVDAVLGTISKQSKILLDDLQSYFRLNAILLDLKNGENIITTVSNHLDSLELQNPIFHEAYKIDWSEAIDDLNGSLFYRDAFKGGPYVFDSIPEISTRGLRTSDPAAYDQFVKTCIKDKFVSQNRYSTKIEAEIEDKFITQLSASEPFKKAFRNYHKYIAIVHADGDNFGKTVMQTGMSVSDVKSLSSLLFGFAFDAAKKIGEYGGTNVYAGGDDLLFFAPVATTNDNGNQTIFDLINELDTHFKETVSDKLINITEKDRPTLSWGVSISYYKFPLAEALVNSRKLLFYEAKEFEGKNAVAFTFFKHSGQSIGATFGKSNDDYKIHFKNLLSQAFVPDFDFISSLQYRIGENEALLRETFNAVSYQINVENFFDNFFDEEIHSNKKVFVQAVRDMLIQAFDDCKITAKEWESLNEAEKEKAHAVRVKKAIEKTYAALRFVHFLNSKSDE